MRSWRFCTRERYSEEAFRIDRLIDGHMLKLLLLSLVEKSLAKTKVED